MAHKAKPKKKMADTDPETKTTLRAKTNSRRKTTQLTKTTPATKSEEMPEPESNQKRETKQGKRSLLSCSLRDPVIRSLGNPAAKASAPPEKAQHPKTAKANPKFRILSKQENRSNSADITGKRALTMWKKSPGRSKSWAVCRRLKLSQEDLELLIQSKTTPVSLGWQFSVVISPAVFVRSQGVRVYEQSVNKTKQLSRAKGFDDPEDDWGARWPVPKRITVKGRKSCQEIERRDGGEVAFLRLTFDHGHVSMTQEAFLEKVLLSTLSKNAKYPGTSLPTHLVAISLLRNESHADVYLVANPSYPSRFYHAHAFLTAVSGNWLSFSKRKMDRLRKSQGFYAETVQRGRKIIIMDTDLKADEEFCMKSMKREFPPLPGTRKTHSSRFLDPYSADDNSVELKPPTKLRKDRDSYAAVVQWGQRKKHVDSNHRAYKAWEDRKGTGMKMMARDKAPAPEPKLSLPETVEGFKIWVGRRKMQKVFDRNRVPIVSRVIT